ncbi:hypothetical protein [Oceaniglobus indicus]|uniref:hypothetical protein n=1 Tax=Oceaniglobus indicus TaxID=2047749 RepID=UPI0013046EC5|nr:hypothetical protein [Oceaniglobus indicus]
MVVGYLFVGILTGIFGGTAAFALDHGMWSIAPITYFSAMLGFTLAAAARHVAATSRQD